MHHFRQGSEVHVTFLVTPLFIGWGLVCYIILQTIHRWMVNQRGHTRSLNRYYVVIYSHAQTPGMNICCFVKCASTVMPAAAPLCYPTYWHLVRKCRNPLTLWQASDLKPQLLWRWLTGSTGWWDMPVSVWNEPRSGKKTTMNRKHWPLEFTVGSQVLLSTSYLCMLGGRKLSPRWIGPFRVAARVGVVAYCLKLPS